MVQGGKAVDKVVVVVTTVVFDTKVVDDLDECNGTSGAAEEAGVEVSTNPQRAKRCTRRSFESLLSSLRP
jgi:hypothetical protein